MSLVEELKSLRREYMAAPFWFWNDVMDPVEIRRQIVEMAGENVGGFFMHARMGRVTPYMSKEWMQAVRAAVDEARKLGMSAWIYDEDGWPSGYGGGAVNALGEEYLQQYALAEVISLREGTSVPIDDAGDLVALFAARKTPGGFDEVQRLDPGRIDNGVLRVGNTAGDHVILFRRELHNYRRFFAPESWADGYVDVLNPKVTRAFIRKIYEPYRREIGGAFGPVVRGVFTDEPSYHDWEWGGNAVRLPMSPVLEREFEKRYGAPLIDSLVTIGFGGPDRLRARWCYYSSLAHLFANNYTRILANWCSKHGLKFTGHYLLEECPRAATHVVGDVMQHYAYQQYPGIDHLGKDLDLKDFWSSARVLVKQAASVAHQLGKPRVMCETYAGGGWDFGVAEQKWMGDWQYALGLNLCCQHAFHYSLRGFRKRDYPPSLSFQQPWWPFSADLGAHFSRLGYLLTRGRRVVNVLVLHPIESFFATHDVAGFPWPDDPMGEALKKLIRHLLAHQIDFDFGNEVLLRKHGRVDGSRIVIGSGSYDVVIVPHSLTWRKSTLAAVSKFAAAGGRLFCVEPLPTHVEGLPSDAYGKLVSGAVSLGRWDDPGFEQRIAEQVGQASRPACRLAGETTHDREVLVMHRRTDEHDIFFLASGTKKPHTTRATFNVPGTPLLLDTTTGQMLPMVFQRHGDACHMNLEFDYARSFPILFDHNSTGIGRAETCVEEKHLCREGDAVSYHLDRDNALILDRGELLVNGESAGRMAPLDARQKLAECKDEPPVCLRFTFTSELPIAAASLLLETPERFKVKVNAREVPVSAAGGWVVDRCLRRIVIPGGLRAGENVVELHFRWGNDLELEPAYVLGRFGVYESAGNCRIGPLPDCLAVGSWHWQGLAFYAGCVTYTLHANLETEADRWELHCPRYRSAIRVLVNGVEAGTLLWAPHRIDLTRHLRGGRNRIDLQVAGSLRNFLGPHHLSIEDDIDCLGPQGFFDTGHRTTEYRFKPAGLLGEVVLRGYV